MENREEAQRIRRCAEGEGEAWREFVTRYSGWVVSVVSGVLRAAGVPQRSGEADELAASVFLKLWENDRALLKRYDSRYAPATWLRVIAVSTARDFLRSRGVSHPLPDDLAGEGGPSERLAAEERQEAVRRGMARLSPRDRLLLELHAVRNLPYETIARLLKVKINSVGPLLARAKSRLREELRK